MPSLSITDLKKGALYQKDGVPYKVVEYSQKVMGRGGSIVNVVVKSLFDGKVHHKTFKGSDSLEPAEVANKTAQYLYSENDKHYFMDQATFDNYDIPSSLLGEQAKFLVEGMEVQAQNFRGNIINIELPKNVYLKVSYSEDAVKGDSSSAITKEAKLETGATVKVPAFIKTGDIISVDTLSGKYRERKKD